MKDKFTPLTKSEIDNLSLSHKDQFANLNKSNDEQVKISKIEKSINKAFLKNMLKETKKFEDYYTSLYSKLALRIQMEYEELPDKNKKIEFLQELKDTIIDANHKMDHKYSISEEAEGQRQNLNALFNTFESKQNKLYEPSTILRNKYPLIFKDDYSYNLFLELHNQYKKQKKTTLANYSFIFHAMTEDEIKYLTCRPIDYIKFLSEFDIQIDKVDTRQSSQTKKLTIYNTIKENLTLKFSKPK